MYLLCVEETNNSSLDSYDDYFDNEARNKGLFYMTPVPSFFAPTDSERMDREREDVDRILTIALRDIYGQLLEEKMQNGPSLKIFYNLAQEILSDAGEWLNEDRLNDILKFAKMCAYVIEVPYEESVRVLIRYHKKVADSSNSPNRYVISPVSVFAACFSDTCMRELSSQPHSVESVRRCKATLEGYEEVNRSILVLLKSMITQDEVITEEDVIDNVYTFVKTYCNHFEIDMKESESRLITTIKEGIRVLGGI